jgi:hypothetical protein
LSADGHFLDAVRHERLEQLAVLGFGPPTHEAEHRRLTRPIDIRIEQANAGALGRQREREIDGERRFADAALARRDGDDILDAFHRFQAVLHGMRLDRRADIDRHDRIRGIVATLLGNGRNDRPTATLRREAKLDVDCDLLLISMNSQRAAAPAQRPIGGRQNQRFEPLPQLIQGKGRTHDSRGL